MVEPVDLASPPGVMVRVPRTLGAGLLSALVLGVVPLIVLLRP